MRYRLCDNYQLEGWRNLPTGVYDTVKGRTIFLPKEEYRLLLHMNGTDDIATEDLTHKDLAAINRMLEQKLIKICSDKEPLLPEQKYKYFDRDFIAHVHWAITGKCNYLCKHCYMYSPLEKFHEPSLEECRKIIKSMQDAGVRSVSLTGGEPLVRADFMELVNELSRHGIRVKAIYTNGALVTDKLLNELAMLGQKPDLHISYDGAQYHDWLRGVPGAGKRAVDAIKISCEHGNKVFAAMCVHNKNKEEMLETVSFLASLGVVRTKIKFMLPNGMWTEEHGDESPQIGEAVNLVIRFIDGFFSMGMPSNVTVDRMFIYNKELKECAIPFVNGGCENTFLCRKAAVNPFIGPTGAVLPCMTLGGCDFMENFPNIMEKPLSEIMSDSYYRDVTHVKIKDFFEMHEECKNCEEKSVCSTGCRACATGNYFNLDRWNCRFFKDGYYRKVYVAIDNAIKKYNLTDKVEYVCITK